jgi:hypothetical protein
MTQILRKYLKLDCQGIGSVSNTAEPEGWEPCSFLSNSMRTEKM